MPLSFWILLELRMTEVVVTSGAIWRTKLHSYPDHQQTSTQHFTAGMPFLLPNKQCPSTERKKYHITQSCSPPKLIWVFQPCLRPLKAPNYLGGVVKPLVSALTLVPHSIWNSTYVRKFNSSVRPIVSSYAFSALKLLARRRGHLVCRKLYAGIQVAVVYWSFVCLGEEFWLSPLHHLLLVWHSATKGVLQTAC